MAEEILKKKEVINKTKQQTHKSKENKYFTPDTWNPYRLDRKTKTKPAGVKQSKTGERKKKRTMHNETGSRRKRQAQQNQSCY